MKKTAGPKYLPAKTVLYTACACTALLCTAILTAAFVIPFIAAIAPAFTSVHEEESQYAFFSVIKPAFFTVRLAFFSTALAVAVGLPAAYLIANKKFLGRSFLESLSAIPLCFPPLLVALGYVSAFGMQGSVNKALMKIFNLELPPITFLYSFAGIILVQGFYNFPIVMKTVGDSWKRIPKEMQEAAKMLGAKKFCIFRTVTIFQLLPSLAASSLIVFLFCFFSFIIVLLFGTVGSATLEVEIYQAARSTLNFHKASVLSLLETAIAVSVIALHAKAEKLSQKNTGISFSNDESGKDDKNGESFLKNSPLSEKIPAAFVISLIAVFFLLPLFMLAVNAFSGNAEQRAVRYMNFTFANFIKIFSQKSFYVSVTHTFQTAFSTAVLCTAAGTAYSFALKRFSNPKTIFRIVPLLPMAVSSIVTGFGMTQFIRRGSPLTLILAQSALYWPFAFRQIMHGADRIPKEIQEASVLLTSRRFDRCFSVMLPLCKTNMIGAFGFCFAMSAGDASLPLILAIPRYDTLSLFTYRLASSYRFDDACACGCILALLTAGVFYLSSKFSEKNL
ncbi:iron ABC transporter permease [Treponema parvum]|uniref:Iron ABC transporter permease n=1 Tax=Treponema parvum TaxID=138851 RepID=A0A975F0C8_9SPIR|nr:iron ABC transporter permease [Treponema parvum]QTQ12169.1 iron ABC transporter permease [Treponema parvum]